MTLSYSGLTNYGKFTLPSVEAWNTNMNITKDPPRSVMTRKIDKVSDTSEITATLAASDDRFCEFINYYARGNNPMVSVSYGEGQTQMNTSSRGQSYLPYRVIRDGAFRPPVWTQRDLLPLSRLPRNWTTVDPKPFMIDYSKRVFNCGTAENTQQVKNEIAHIECETRKTISTEPSLTVPQVKYMLKDPLAPGMMTKRSTQLFSQNPEKPEIVLPNQLTTSARTNQSTPFFVQNPEKPEIVLPNQLTTSARTNQSTPFFVQNPEKPEIVLPNQLTTSARTNQSTPFFVQNPEKPEIVLPNQLTTSARTNQSTPFFVQNPEKPEIVLPNQLTTSARTNQSFNKQEPVVFNNVRLTRNHPLTSAFTNLAGPAFNVQMTDVEYNRLLPSKHYGSYDARPNIPQFSRDNDSVKLIRVR